MHDNETTREKADRADTTARELVRLARERGLLHSTIRARELFRFAHPAFHADLLGLATNLIEACARQDPAGIDGRNEHAVAHARRICEAMGITV